MPPCLEVHQLSDVFKIERCPLSCHACYGTDPFFGVAGKHHVNRWPVSGTMLREPFLQYLQQYGRPSIVDSVGYCTVLCCSCLNNWASRCEARNMKVAFGTR